MVGNKHKIVVKTKNRKIIIPVLPTPPFTPPDPTDLTKPQSLAPQTTLQQDLTMYGQRRINLIWEYSQASIALIVVLCNMVAALFNVLNYKDINVPPVLSSSLFLVIGFYFGRTNHTQIGGVGNKPDQPYVGR